MHPLNPRLRGQGSGIEACHMDPPYGPQTKCEARQGRNPAYTDRSETGRAYTERSPTKPWRGILGDTSDYCWRKRPPRPLASPPTSTSMAGPRSEDRTRRHGTDPCGHARHEPAGAAPPSGAAPGAPAATAPAIMQGMEPAGGGPTADAGPTSGEAKYGRRPNVRSPHFDPRLGPSAKPSDQQSPYRSELA